VISPGNSTIVPDAVSQSTSDTLVPGGERGRGREDSSPSRLGRGGEERAGVGSGAGAMKDDRLPSFWGFVAVAAIANAPVVGLLLLRASIKPAFSVAVGLATGLVVYGTLHLFINRGLDFFLVGVRGQAQPQSGGSAVLIAMLLPLKYVVIGAALYWLVNAGALAVPWVAVGFMITQVAVTAKSMKRLKSMPLL